MSIKKYMIYDLLMLGIFGAVLEGLCVWCSFYALVGNIASTILSVLIVFTAIIRWKWWGITITPLVAFGSFIGGMFTDYKIYEKYDTFFEFRYYISLVVGLAAIGLLCLLIFRKKDFQKDIKSLPHITGYAALAFVIYEVFMHLSYMISQGTNSQIQGTFIFDFLGLIITMVGVFVLNRQGFLVNVRQKLIDDKNDIEEEAKHEKLEL